MSKSKTSSRRSKYSGRFFILSAPSGTGKTTIVRRLLKHFPGMERSISCTTRPPRPGEKDGVDYHFISELQFCEMKEEGAFFEWEEVHDSFYGTPKAPLLKRRDAGQDTVLDIDTRGALNLKKSYPESCLIFLLPPSLSVLEERLKGRKTEAEVSIQRRLTNARHEMAEKDKYDYVIINDDIDRAFDEVRDIVEKERGR